MTVGMEMNLETIGRTLRKYDSTIAKITGAVAGEGIEQYFAFEIVDYGEIEQAWAYSLPHPSETELYFVSNFVMRDKPADLISRIIGLNRGEISFEVTEETEEMKEFFMKG